MPQHSLMADSTSPFLSTQRCAVVTGANKGIGLEICRQLASKGVVVVLTSRDEKRGLHALDTLINQQPSFCGLLEFHQLDVTQPQSISSLVEFVESKFRKLDILANNAGVVGSSINTEAFSASVGKPREQIDYSQITTENYDPAQECFEINYYGPKRMTSAFLPLLRKSDSSRIVNISSFRGKLQHITNEKVREVLDKVESLTEEKIDGVLDDFMEDLKKGEQVAKGWPLYFAPYTASKAALNAYTRITAAKYGDVDINCVNPGFVMTEMNCMAGVLTVEEGAEAPVNVALLPKGGASGVFFEGKNMDVSSF